MEFDVFHTSGPFAAPFLAQSQGVPKCHVRDSVGVHEKSRDQDELDRGPSDDLAVQTGSNENRFRNPALAFRRRISCRRREGITTESCPTTYRIARVVPASSNSNSTTLPASTSIVRDWLTRRPL